MKSTLYEIQITYVNMCYKFFSVFAAIILIDFKFLLFCYMLFCDYFLFHVYVLIFFFWNTMETSKWEWQKLKHTMDFWLWFSFSACLVDQKKK